MYHTIHTVKHTSPSATAFRTHERTVSLLPWRRESKQTNKHRRLFLLVANPQEEGPTHTYTHCLFHTQNTHIHFLSLSHTPPHHTTTTTHKPRHTHAPTPHPPTHTPPPPHPPTHPHPPHSLTVHPHTLSAARVGHLQL